MHALASGRLPNYLNKPRRRKDGQGLQAVLRRQHNSGFNETTTTERCNSPNNGSTTNTSDDATERRANVLFRWRAGLLRRGGRCSDPGIMTSHNDVIKYFSQNFEGLIFQLIFHFSIQALESYSVN